MFKCLPIAAMVLLMACQQNQTPETVPAVLSSTPVETIITQTTLQSNLPPELQELDSLQRLLAVDSLNTQAQERYFEIFPKDYNSFNNVFGYLDGAQPLYETSYEHVNLYFGLKGNQTKFVNKTIDIALGGHWDADAVNYFQNNTIEYFVVNDSIFAKELSKRPTTQISSFWKFCLDGPHPEISATLDVVVGRYPELYKLMKESFEEVSSHDDHGH